MRAGDHGWLALSSRSKFAICCHENFHSVELTSSETRHNFSHILIHICFEGWFFQPHQIRIKSPKRSPGAMSKKFDTDHCQRKQLSEKYNNI